MQLVEVVPLKAFCGTFKCSLSEADLIDEALVEKEGGVIVKEKVPRKRYIGKVPTVRAITPDEHNLWKEGKLPKNIVADDGGKFVTVYPEQRTVMVPADVASSLIARGIAERVEPKKSK